MGVNSAVLNDLTFAAATSAGSMSSNQFCIVALSGSVVNGLPWIILCTGTSFNAAGALGILQDNPAAGRAAIVRPFGGGNTSKVQATTSGGISLGAAITCSTAGQAMAADTTGQFILGKAINVPSTSPTVGMVIEVLLNGPFPFVLS